MRNQEYLYEYEPEGESIVEGVIERFSLEDARETFEAYASDIVKLMNEEELKELLKRFLHKGDSERFVQLELENLGIELKEVV